MLKNKKKLFISKNEMKSSFQKHYCLYKIAFLNVNSKRINVSCFAQIILNKLLLLLN